VTNRSLAHPAQPSTREHRALALYRDHHHEIVLVGTDRYEVPSCTGSGVYEVEYGGDVESCTCPDARRHPEFSCKHVLAVGICRAKRRGGDHHRILEDAREHPERTYRQHVEAAQEIAAEEYREEVRRMMRAGIL
jgi:hypothetical protein